MSTFLIIAGSLAIGAALGAWGGVRIASKDLLWRVRMHFYAQGMNHKGVDEAVQNVFHEPGLPDGDAYRRVKDHRVKDGFKP